MSCLNTGIALLWEYSACWRPSWNPIWPPSEYLFSFELYFFLRFVVYCQVIVTRIICVLAAIFDFKMTTLKRYFHIPTLIGGASPIFHKRVTVGILWLMAVYMFWSKLQLWSGFFSLPFRAGSYLDFLNITSSFTYMYMYGDGLLARILIWWKDFSVPCAKRRYWCLLMVFYNSIELLLFF